MGLVSQECLLFHGSVEDNIRYGCEGAASAAVVAAAQAAYAHEFIKAMPQVRACQCVSLCVCAVARLTPESC